MGDDLEARIIIRNVDSSNDTPDNILPKDIEEIEPYAFSNTAATYVYIQDSENRIKIGEKAFSGCANLVQIRIPNSVTEIADNAFDQEDIIVITPQDSYAQE